MSPHLADSQPGAISPGPSPALTHRVVPSISGLDLDLSLPTSVSNLINHLCQPLSRIYPPSTISGLKLHLTSSLTELFAPTWNTDHPQFGSGFRSLICTGELGLPKVLRESAREAKVDPEVWRRSLARLEQKDENGVEVGSRRRNDEWEAWCDPGTVIWRYGGWEWEDIGYEPFKVVRESYQIIWQTSTSPRLANPPPSTKKSAATEHAGQSTPLRPSHAIPIRAPVPLPAVFAIPPTPAHSTLQSSTVGEQAPLLPAAAISRTPSPSQQSDSSFGYQSSEGQMRVRVGSNVTSISTGNKGHRNSGSNSSIDSNMSDNSGLSQLLTPNSRPPSVDMFSDDKDKTLDSQSPTPIAPGRGRTPSPVGIKRDSAASTQDSATPIVTPYDGGNVTVMGGGVKLGAASSRPASVASARTSYDRSRSPSVSFASRALNSAMGPNGQPTGNRKARSRRRIVPTYLGTFGQPGMGGPVGHGFGGYASQPGSPWMGGGVGVGVGMGPPPVPGMNRPPGMGSPRISSI